MLREQGRRPLTPRRIVIAPVEAGQAQELVGSLALVLDRSADGLLVWRPGVGRHYLPIALELGQVRKAEAARDDELGIGTGERGELGRARLRARQARMELAHHLGCAGVTGTDRALQRLGAVAELLEVCVTWKTAGWHRGLLSQGPG